MVIPEEKDLLLRRCIETIYSCPIDEKQLIELAPKIARITDSHYFSILLYPNGIISKRKYLTNNLPSYSKLYASLIPKDFLLQNMLNNSGITMLNAFSVDQVADNKEFCVEAVRSRPITDICYVPITIHGYLAGHAAVARAGMNRKMKQQLHLPRLDAENDPFSENDISLICFITGFVNEGLKRLVEAPPEEEEIACFDSYGRVVSAGGRISDVLKLLFGDRFWNAPGLRASGLQADGVKAEGAAAFSGAFRNFIHGPLQPGDGEFVVPYQDRQFRFVFERLPSADLRLYFPEEPQVMVRVQESGTSAGSSGSREGPGVVQPDIFQELKKNCGLTTREAEAADCIRRGLSNLEISRTMRISEETVKRHIYNAFRKTGVHSRTEFLFRVTGPLQ